MKELPVLEYIDQDYVVTCALNARDLRIRQLPSYSAISTKKELLVVEYMDKGYVVTCVPKCP